MSYSRLPLAAAAIAAVLSVALLLAVLYWGLSRVGERGGLSEGGVASRAAVEVARRLSASALSSAPQLARGGAGGVRFLLGQLASTMLYPVFLVAPSAMEPGESVVLSCEMPRLEIAWTNATAITIHARETASTATYNLTVIARGRLLYLSHQKTNSASINYSGILSFNGGCVERVTSNLTFSTPAATHTVTLEYRYENCTPVFVGATTVGENVSIILDRERGEVIAVENGVELPLNHSIAASLARLVELLPSAVRAETLRAGVANGSRLYTVLVEVDATVGKPVPIGFTARATLTLLEARPWLLVAQRVELASLRAWITLNNTTYTIEAHNITLDFNCTVHRG